MCLKENRAGKIVFYIAKPLNPTINLVTQHHFKVPKKQVKIFKWIDLVNRQIYATTFA